MSDKRDNPTDTGGHGFAKAPSTEEWLGLLRELSEDLAVLEERIENIRACELTSLDDAAVGMRSRIDMIRWRISKQQPDPACTLPTKSPSGR